MERTFSGRWIVIVILAIIAIVVGYAAYVLFFKTNPAATQGP
jgi:flagellar basal body-associated protein FliL